MRKGSCASHQGFYSITALWRLSFCRGGLLAAERDFIFRERHTDYFTFVSIVFEIHPDTLLCQPAAQIRSSEAPRYSNI